MMKKYILAVVLLAAANIMVAAKALILEGPRVFNGQTAYEINEEDRRVDVYQNNQLALSIALGPNHPVAVAITPDGSTVYVASRENIIHIIDTMNNIITGTVINPLIQDPVNLTMSDNGTTLSVINADGSTVTIDVATNTVI